MIELGDLWVADLNDERRHDVLVVSNARFHRLSGRALVAPAVSAVADEVPFPWRLDVDGTFYGLDLARSLPLNRLLAQTGRAPEHAVAAIRRVLRNIC